MAESRRRPGVNQWGGRDPGRMVVVNLWVRPALRERLERIASLHGISISQCARVELARALATSPARPAPEELQAAASRTDLERGGRGRG